MDKSLRYKHTNSYHSYKERYRNCLKHSPEQKSKWEIGELNECLITIRHQSIAHDNTQFNPEELREPLALLYDEYTNKVLESINTLNEMQGLKIVFSYDPRKTLLHKGIARPILKIIDNELERYKEAGEYPRSEIVYDEF